MEVIDRIYSFMGVMLNNVKSTTRILQRKIGKVPKNTISTTKFRILES